MKDRAIRFIERHGCNGTHAFLLNHLNKYNRCSDFMALLSSMIKALDLMNSGRAIDFKQSSFIFEKSQLTYKELVNLHSKEEYITCTYNTENFNNHDGGLKKSNILSKVACLAFISS